ncbi:uncharacterized protein PHACADRAFT_251576, partial [Phanerochaete carnosa HHB-10118-sp]
MSFDDDDEGDGDSLFLYNVHDDSGYAEPLIDERLDLHFGRFPSMSDSPLPGSSIASYVHEPSDLLPSISHISEPLAGWKQTNDVPQSRDAFSDTSEAPNYNADQLSALSFGHLQSSTDSPLLECSPRSLHSLGCRSPGMHYDNRRLRLISDTRPLRSDKLSSSQSSEHSVVEETLADVVHGCLFEDS